MEEQTSPNITPQAAPQLSKKERRQLRREEKYAELERSRGAKKHKTFLVWGAGLLLVGLAGFGVFRFFLNAPADSQADPLRGCIQHGGVSMHIHPKLRLVINGETREIPENIGVSQLCMRPLHTHDNSGTIHVEFPRPHDFTLGDFFRVWDKEFSRTQILDYTIDETHEIMMTVNGETSEAYETLILRDGEQVEIQYKAKEGKSLEEEKKL